MRVARFRALYGPPESWRHILIDMLAVLVCASAGTAVLMYGFGMSWPLSTAVLVGGVVCYSVVRLVISWRRYARLRAELRQPVSPRTRNDRSAM
jgi:hypothetical protein